MQDQKLTIAFSGLGLFRREDVGSQKLSFYLVPDGSHNQVMIFRAVDIYDAMDFAGSVLPVTPGLDGEELAEIVVSGLVKFHLVSPGDVVDLDGPAASIDLAGIPSATELGLDPGKARMDYLKTCTRVAVPKGSKVECGDYVKKRDGSPAKWQFGSSNSARELSNFVYAKVLIPQGKAIQVSVDGKSIQLSPPGGGNVALSITNYPRAIPIPGTRDDGSHMRMLHRAFEGVKANDVKYPRRQTSGSTAGKAGVARLKPSSICPPADGGP